LHGRAKGLAAGDSVYFELMSGLESLGRIHAKGAESAIDWTIVQAQSVEERLPSFDVITHVPALQGSHPSSSAIARRFTLTCGHPPWSLICELRLTAQGSGRS
jgi:hypothetical protein